ncbi:MAG: cysteine dioxygenase family protein [Planctomycetota bacterium]
MQNSAPDGCSGAALSALGPSQRQADCTLDALTVRLAPLLCDSEGRRRANGAEVAALLKEYAASEESWRRYAQFRDDTYSRHLIWRCGDFEMLLLCWNEGQASPIHDHAGQQCWMAVLEGELEEVHFNEVPDGSSVAGGSVASLEAGRVKAFPSGGVAFIDDDIALHLVRPTPGTRGVSLHLYSSPIDSCRVFCPETGKPTAIRAGYHTVRGVPAEGADPDAIRAAWSSAT